MVKFNTVSFTQTAALAPQHLFQSPSEHLREDERTELYLPPQGGYLGIEQRLELLIQWFGM